ncbi:MAG: cyclic nucleotide-binding domain-containing protein [Planctomycetia bacterium]|nr:cyclic nucleotide-binding domain-containing protein [Planctomycetia bacterium]
MSSADETIEMMFDGRMVAMPRALAALVEQPPVRVTIDGQAVEVPRVSLSYDPTDKPIPRLTTIYDAAHKAKIDIPVLCHREYMTPVAVCRVCSVEVKSADGRTEPRLAPACYRPVEPGMVVATHHTSAKVKTAVSGLTELLMADHPSPCEKHRLHQDCELETLAQKLQIKDVRFQQSAAHRPHDASSLVIAVDHNACILCDRCVRGCNEIRHNEVLGRRGKGYGAGVAFDLNNPMGESSCVACGECMVSCPTGALTNRGVVRAEPLPVNTAAVQPLSAEELAKLPLFEGVAPPFLRFNEGAVVRRHYRKGEIICREGEYGSTAFYLEKGKVDIFIQAPLKHVRGDKNRRGGARIDWGPLGLIRRFTSTLAGRAQDRRDEESTTPFIPIDAPVTLRYDNPVATLEAGELFGEMTCMNSYPRSATVRATEDCTALEMLRNVLYVLRRGKRSRALLDERYRRRAIDNHLRGVSIFASLLEDEARFAKFVDFLRDRVELIRVDPGQVIFRQGEPADHFYLVRIGFVKVSQRQPGGEHVLAYIGPGKYFGEIGLLSHIPEVAEAAPPGVRTATCSALDHVELVRVGGDDFRAVLDLFPEVRARIVQIALERLTENERARQQAASVSLGDFLSQGLMNAQSLLVLDLEKCTRCDECTKACADAHDGVTRLIREGLRFDKYLVTTSCRSCMDPYCMAGCPVGAIRRRNSREIIIEDWCIGCGNCATNCPYGNINMHPFEEQRPDLANPGRTLPVVQQKATLCDLCSGLDGQPSCVYACPHDAAHRMTGPELLKEVQAEAARRR